MPRPPRFDPPGTWHHLMNRGARRQTVFLDDRDRSDFVDLISRFSPEFSLEVHLYCLVGNHFHLVVRSLDGRISEGMKFLSERFTRLSNDRHGFDGSIFRGRFHNVLVEVDEHHRWLFNYVHSNIRDTGWSGPIDQYPWSSLPTYVSATPSVPDPWLVTGFYAGLFDHDVSRMATFVQSEVGPFVSTPGGTPTTISGEACNGQSDVAVLRERPRLDGITAFDIAAENVMAEWTCESNALTDSRSGSCNEPRLALVLVACDLLGCSTSTIADRLDLSSASSARVLLSRARKRVIENQIFARSIDRIAHGISHLAA